MLLIHTEDDGLLEAVTALLQKLRDAARDQLGALVKDQNAVEVLGVVDAVLDLLSIAVRRALLRTIPLDVAVKVDLDDFVGCQEAIADALLQ